MKIDLESHSKNYRLIRLAVMDTFGWSVWLYGSPY